MRGWTAEVQAAPAVEVSRLNGWIDKLWNEH